MLIGPRRRSAYSAPIRTLPSTARQRVQRAHVAHLRHQPQLQVVLQVLADARQSGARPRCRSACSTSGRPMPDSSQELRRIDRAGREQHLRARAHDVRRRRRRRTRTPVHAAALDDEPVHLRRVTQREVRAARDRPQERLRRVPAHAAPLVHLEIADALVVAGVEVGGGGNADLLAAASRPPRGSPSAAAAPRRATSPPAPWNSLGAAVVVLAALEQRQHRVPAPAVVAGSCGPRVVVRRAGRACRSCR